MDPETAAEQEGRPYVGPAANGSTPHAGEQAPPVHEAPAPAPQPMQVAGGQWPRGGHGTRREPRHVPGGDRATGWRGRTVL